MVEQTAIDVAITGMGVWCSVARSVSAFVDALRLGHCGIKRLETDWGAFTGAKIGAEIGAFSLAEAVAARDLPAEMLKRAERGAARAPRSLNASVLCALEAWEMARLHVAAVPTEGVALIVAHDSAFGREQYDLFGKFAQAPEYVSPKLPLHAIATDHVGVVSEVLEIRGEGFAVAGASAAGNVALIKGMQLVRSEDADVCVVLGALSDLSPLLLQGLHNMGAICSMGAQGDPARACRPFDRGASGFVYGQAAACVVLESMASVRRRGMSPLALLLGGASRLDGSSSSAPCEEGERRAMAACLAQAGVPADEVDYVNAHGTSTALGDRTEIAAIQGLFRESLSKTWINSTKCLVGHCLSSAGVIEAVATVVQMQQRFVHPNINLDAPIADCRFVPSESVPADIRVAMSNSFGFGGINSSILLQRADA